MFGKKKLDLEKMSSEEMEALETRLLMRFFLLNILWVLFVFVMLFLLPILGVVLLIITAIKYFYDYHDVKSQERYFGFVKLMEIKRYKEDAQNKDE